MAWSGDGVTKGKFTSPTKPLCLGFFAVVFIPNDSVHVVAEVTGGSGCRNLGHMVPLRKTHRRQVRMGFGYIWKIITVLNKNKGKERMRIRCGSTDRILMRFLLGV
jgi:hypothetical protein